MVDDLLNAGRPCAHDHDTIGQLYGLVDIVRHENDGLVLGFPDAQQFAAHSEARDRIQRAKRLIEKEHVWVDGQCASNFEPLLHAAGEFGG